MSDPDRMFEHRLGLALGKSKAEIRSLPCDEFDDWKLFYMVEPWGWHDREFRVAEILTMLWNTNINKRSQAKKLTTYIRDMYGLIKQAASTKQREAQMGEKFRTASMKDKKRMIAASLGRPLKDK